eukprot:Rmarinus@m.3546
MSSVLPNAMLTLLTFLVGISIYINSLGAGFVWDDLAAIERNRDLRPTTPIFEIFKHDFWGDDLMDPDSNRSYRPLTTLSFRLNYAFSNLDPYCYHLTNVILHAIVCGLYFHVCLVLSGSRLLSFSAAILFAVHPIHTEAVSGLVGRAELLSGVFFCLSILVYLRCVLGSTTRPTRFSALHVVLSTALAGLGMLCKEPAITAPAVAVLFDALVVCNWSGASEEASGSAPHAQSQSRFSVTGSLRLFSQRPRWFVSLLARACAVGILVASLMVVRMWVMGFQPPSFHVEDNPVTYEDSVLTRTLTYQYLYYRNMELLIYPVQLCFDWSGSAIPLVESFSDPRNLRSLSLWGLLLIWGVWGWQCYLGRRTRADCVPVMSLALTVVPFLPASNLLFPVGFVLGERVLYLPSMGFCLVVSFLISRLANSLLQLFATEDDECVFGTEAVPNKQSASMVGATGGAGSCLTLGSDRTTPRTGASGLENYREASRQRGGRKKYKTDSLAEPRAHDTHPTSSHVVSPPATPLVLSLVVLLGGLYAQRTWLRNYDWHDNTSLFESGLTVNPTNVKAWVNLGYETQKNSGAEAAIEFYTKATEIDPEDSEARTGLGAMYMRLGDYELATEHFLKAYHTARANKDTYDPLLNLGRLAQLQGNHDQAIAQLEEVLKVNPRYKPLVNAYLYLAESLKVEGRMPEALQHLRTYVMLMPEDNDGLYQLGIACVEEGSPEKASDAVHYLSTVITRDPYFTLANFQLGQAFYTLGKYQEATDAFAIAAGVAPDKDVVHYHYGLALHKLGRWRDAELSFRKSFKLGQPHSKKNAFLLTLIAQSTLYADADIHRAQGLSPDMLQRRREEALTLAQHALQVEPRLSEAKAIVRQLTASKSP